MPSAVERDMQPTSWTLENQISWFPSSSISILPSLCCQTPTIQRAHALCYSQSTVTLPKWPSLTFSADFPSPLEPPATPCIISYVPKLCCKPLVALHLHNIQDMKTWKLSKAGSSRCRQPNPRQMVLPRQTISHPKSNPTNWTYTCSRLIVELISSNVRIRHSSGKFKILLLSSSLCVLRFTALRIEKLLFLVNSGIKPTQILAKLPWDTVFVFKDPDNGILKHLILCTWESASLKITQIYSNIFQSTGYNFFYRVYFQRDLVI